MRFRPDESRPAPIDGVTDIQTQKIVSTGLLQLIAFGSGVMSAGTRWITQGIIPVPFISEQFHTLQAQNDVFYQWIYSIPDFASMLFIGMSSTQCITLITAILHSREDRLFNSENEMGYRKQSDYEKRLQLHERRILALEVGEILTQFMAIAAIAWMYFSQELNQFSGIIRGTPQKDDLMWYACAVVVMLTHMALQRVVLYGSAAYRYNNSQKSDN